MRPKSSGSSPSSLDGGSLCLLIERFLAIVIGWRFALPASSQSEASTVAVGFSPRLNVIASAVAERRLNQPHDVMPPSIVAPRRNLGFPNTVV